MQMIAETSLAKIWIKTKVFILDGLLRPERPMNMLRFGTYYGGWWIPSVSPEQGPAFCVGAGFDVSFDLELQRLAYTVYTIDPTPASIDHVRATAPTLNIVPIGVAEFTGEATFYEDPTWKDSWAISTGERKDLHTKQMPVVSLVDLAERLNEDTINILKLDIEGAEHRVIRTIAGGRKAPKCICVEFDDRRLTRVISSVRTLRHRGYTLIQIENWNYTFVKTE